MGKNQNYLHTKKKKNDEEDLCPICQKNLYLEMNEIGIDRISSRPYKINSDPNGIIWIRYKESQKNQYISASSVFDGKFEESKFKNKTIRREEKERSKKIR